VAARRATTGEKDGAAESAPPPAAVDLGLNLFDLEPLHRRKNGVGIEANAATAQPDDGDCLGFDEILNESFADVEFPGNADQVGQLVVVVGQGEILGPHWNRFRNGWLSVVCLVELFDEFHDVLLLSPVGENPEFLV
jgi:hypothetical protein